MFVRRAVCAGVLAGGAALAALQAAGISEQQAEAFSRKWAQVARHAVQPDSRPAPVAGTSRRTNFSEAEVNSWFAYRAQDVLPAGVTQPKVAMMGDNRFAATAVLDLETLAKQKATGRTLDPWSYLGGRVPVVLNGVLHTQNGVGRLDVVDASVSGVPVPKTLLQEVVSFYSRSAASPDGVRLDDPFLLPARIQQIEVGMGQAVVVQ